MDGNMLAVGGYLQARREMVGLQQDEVAKQIGVSRRILSAWENGHKMPRSDNLVALISVIHADRTEVDLLMNDPQADREAGRRLAQGLDPKTRAEVERIIDSSTDEELAQFMDELRKNRKLLPTIREMWESLKRVNRDEG